MTAFFDSLGSFTGARAIVVGTTSTTAADSGFTSFAGFTSFTGLTALATFAVVSAGSAKTGAGTFGAFVGFAEGSPTTGFTTAGAVFVGLVFGGVVSTLAAFGASLVWEVLGADFSMIAFAGALGAALLAGEGFLERCSPAADESLLTAVDFWDVFPATGTTEVAFAFAFGSGDCFLVATGETVPSYTSVRCVLHTKSSKLRIERSKPF